MSFFGANFWQRFGRRPVRASEDADEEEDIVDPMDVLREKCAETALCRKLREKFEACEERVSSRSNTTESCAEELIDFVQARDHCVGKQLFKHLK